MRRDQPVNPKSKTSESNSSFCQFEEDHFADGSPGTSAPAFPDLGATIVSEILTGSEKSERGEVCQKKFQLGIFGPLRNVLAGVTTAVKKFSQKNKF